jgi:hypothetical protein
MLQCLNGNHLLAALPREVYRRLCPTLAYLAFALGDIIYEPGEQVVALLPPFGLLRP